MMKRSLVHFLSVLWLFGTFLFGIRFLSRLPRGESPFEAAGFMPPNINDLRFSQMTSSLTSSFGDGVPVKQVGDALRWSSAGNNRTGWPAYFRFRNTGSGEIWPKSGGSRREDRILSQLHLTHVDDTSGNGFKKILLYGGLKPTMTPGRSWFVDDGCPVDRCLLTADVQGDASSADAVLFGEFVSTLPFRRPPEQIWIIFLLESAVNGFSAASEQFKFNWTATYRSDSILVTPYERFTFFADHSEMPDTAPRNFAAGKTKKVAWMVSNCHAANGRHNYVKELKKYIDVDVYGFCGSLTCRKGTRDCQEKLRQYKFYLAFENSNCIDYITEKIYWNAFGRNLSDPNDLVPVVMGARPEDYARLAPPKSYIHVDDFESPKALAEYLHKVDQDDDLYNSFFRWKGTGDYIDTKFWCRLCAMIHEAHRTKRHVVLDDFGDWWSGDGACVHPPNGSGWSSWRNDRRRRFDFDRNYFRSWVEK